MSNIYLETNILHLFILRDIAKVALDVHSFNPSPVQIKIDLAKIPAKHIEVLHNQLNQLINSNMKAESLTIDSINPSLKEEFIKYCKSQNQTGDITIKDNPLWEEFIMVKISQGEL